MELVLAEFELVVNLLLPGVSAYLCIKCGETIELIKVQTNLSPHQEICHTVLG
jgi:hypothetical protein